MKREKDELISTNISKEMKAEDLLCITMGMKETWWTKGWVEVGIEKNILMILQLHDSRVSACEWLGYFVSAWPEGNVVLMVLQSGHAGERLLMRWFRTRHDKTNMLQWVDSALYCMHSLQAYPVSRNFRVSRNGKVSRKCYNNSRNLENFVDLLFFCKKTCFWCESETLLVWIWEMLIMIETWNLPSTAPEWRLHRDYVCINTHIISPEEGATWDSSIVR